MQIDISPRRSGKTTRMLQWLAEDENGILIVHSQREVDRLRRLVKDININPDRIVTISNLHNLRGRGTKTKLGFDEFQFILQQLLGLPTERISMTDEGIVLE